MRRYWARGKFQGHLHAYCLLSWCPIPKPLVCAWIVINCETFLQGSNHFTSTTYISLHLLMIASVIFCLQIVTLSKDCHSYVWFTKDGKKHIELVWPKNTKEKYRFRNCGYVVSLLSVCLWVLAMWFYSCFNSCKLNKIHLLRKD